MKKLPVVKHRKGETKNNYGYGFINFNMAWVSDPNLGRYQTTAVMSCREFLCACVRASLYENNYNDMFANDTDFPIDMDRVRLLILNGGSKTLNKQQFKENLFNGKALLNVYEKVGNFSSLSKISTVKHEYYGKQWLITGPKEWMKSGQLISAMSFLLRLATFNGPIDISNLTTVEKSFNKILNKNRIETTMYLGDIDQNLKCFWDKIWILVKYQNELFSDNYKENYKGPLGHSDFGMRCGIRNIAAGTSEIPKGIDEEFKKLCEKHLPRKQ